MSLIRSLPPPLALALLTLSLLPSTALAESEPLPESRQNAEGGPIGEGWFMRLGLGPTLFRGSAEPDQAHLVKVDVASDGPGMHLAVGHSLTDGLLLQGELSMQSMSEPEISDPDGRTQTLPDGRRLRVVSAGPGLTWMFHEYAYLSGGLHGMVLSVDEALAGPQGRVESNLGFALNGQIGAQWSLNGVWTLGVAGALSAGMVSGESAGGGDADWRYLTASLLFTTSFWPGGL